MMIFLRWLGSFVEDANGHTSSKRLALIMGSTALSLGLAAMMFAKAYHVFMNGGDCSLEIAAGSIPLCAMAGVAYSVGKPQDRKPNDPPLSN
jgi:hypothetical protein